MDPNYAGKTLVLEGNANDDFSFYVHKHLDLFWLIPSSENPNKLIGSIVDNTEREKVLSYAIKKARESGYTLTLW